MKRSKTPVKFFCHWCHEEIDLRTPYRVLDSELPAGTAWYVCGEDCPERPEDSRRVFAR